MAPPARTIKIALDMSKAFDTVNTHTLIGKLLQTSTPGTILKFVANYIMGRKAYTSFRNPKSIQRQVKTGVPQGSVLLPTLFNIHTADIPTPTAPVQVMLYAGDITITSTHTSTSAARKYMRPTLEYASSIWSPMASPTSINKLQVMQNAALRACTGCTHDTYTTSA